MHTVLAWNVARTLWHVRYTFLWGAPGRYGVRADSTHCAITAKRRSAEAKAARNKHKREHKKVVKRCLRQSSTSEDSTATREYQEFRCTACCKSFRTWDRPRGCPWCLQRWEVVGETVDPNGKAEPKEESSEVKSEPGSQ